MTALPDVLVVNLHRRFTGVSATVAALLPHQRRTRKIGLIDSGGLEFEGKISLAQALRKGWQRPSHGGRRIWHARRDVEMLWGLVARDLLRQPVAVVFTSAAPKRHGWVLRQIMGRMDAIIASSARAAGFLDWHSTVIPHGVDTDHFTPQDRVAARKAEGLPTGPLIGAFGRLRPSKGTDLLIDALCTLLPQHPDHNAILTGIAAPKDQSFLEAQKQKLAQAGLTDRVHFLGQVSGARLKSLYACCDIVVAASRREGYGLTPLEGGASGAAIVSTTAGVWPEVIDEEIGAIVDTGSATALADALQPLLENPALAQTKGEAARARMVNHHSVRHEAEAINTLYDHLAQTNPPRLKAL
ncbi:MAG: glycosyltransferase family 4 protein [Pseudomonadota bacterium]